MMYTIECGHVDLCGQWPRLQPVSCGSISNQYHKLLHRLHRIYWLCLHRKLTSSRFSPSMGFWQRDAGIGWTHALKCAHAYS